MRGQEAESAGAGRTVAPMAAPDGNARTPSADRGDGPTPLGGFHHVALICSEIGRSREFYTRVLGFRVVAEEYREARRSWKVDLELAPGGMRLELFSFPDAPPRPNQPEARGLRHLAFVVESVAETAGRLESLGVAVEPIRVDQATGKPFTFFKDPDGLPLELYER
jgi:glyoxylase I family protein